MWHSNRDVADTPLESDSSVVNVASPMVMTPLMRSGLRNYTPMLEPNRRRHFYEDIERDVTLAGGIACGMSRELS